MPEPVFAPQLASLTRTPPDGDAWLHEIKYDGYRLACLVHDGAARVISRNGLDWTARFPAIATAARALDAREAWLDGEAAVVLPDGRTSFEALQRVIGDRPAQRTARGPADGRLVYFAFDLLRLDGERLDRLPLETRKTRLRGLLGPPTPSSRLRYADHVVGQGPAAFAQACAMGLEGIVSKRRDQPYTAGRGGGWLKAKCLRRRPFVVGGFTDQVGTAGTLGALLIGAYDNDGRLVYCGRVGTGFTQAVARDLRARLARVERRTAPFDPAPTGAVARTAHWVTPRLVAEVAFTEWTGDRQLRHPSFQGLCPGVQAEDVTLGSTP